ncbi:MAG TPA: ferrochelatase [Candidatus Eisenbacteria bacterium]|jgi:protoheme ferro-lyase
MRRHVVLITYGEPPSAAFSAQLRYSWRILLGLTRLVAPIPGLLLPLIAVSRGRSRNQLWTAEHYTSPLEPITLEQARGIEAALRRDDPGTDWQVHVAYEFRDPLLVPLLDRLPRGEAVDVLPMYVADSAFTHEISRVTVRDWVARAGAGRSGEVRVLPPLDEQRFVEVSADHVARQLDAKHLGGKDWALVLAAHGTLLEPPRPMETGRLATERLCAGIGQRLAGRFGAIYNGWLNHTRGGRWTEPPIEETLRTVLAAGYRKVVYYPYGFSADNAESQLEGRVALRAHAWEAVAHLPTVNADAGFLTALARQVIEARSPARGERATV